MPTDGRRVLMKGVEPPVGVWLLSKDERDTCGCCLSAYVDRISRLLGMGVEGQAASLWDLRPDLFGTLCADLGWGMFTCGMETSNCLCWLICSGLLKKSNMCLKKLILGREAVGGEDREKLWSAASCTPSAEDEACMCPDQNWTFKLLVHRRMLSQLRHTSQGNK